MDFNIFMNDGYDKKKKIYQGVERNRDIEIKKNKKKKDCCIKCAKKRANKKKK